MRCKQCDEFMTYPEDRHTCPPVWRVRMASSHYDDDAEEIFARNAERAAAKFAEDWDVATADYRILSGGGTDVVVIDADGVETKFTVRGEAVPEYWAEEIKAEAEEPGA